MDSAWADKAWAEQLGLSFPMLSDWGGDVTRRYGLYDSQTKKGRRATFIIDKSGRIAEIQLDNEALDPANAVAACERPKLKG